MKPKLLDLFCGAGGAAMGYHRAGFEVVGVDIKPQPHYPFTYCQMDALWAMDKLLKGESFYDNQVHFWSLKDFDAFHASPPCQGYSEATPITTKGNHPLLIKPISKMLKWTRKPYVIENVEGSRHYLETPTMLCGTMFGLKLWRHRWFEIYPQFVWPPFTCNHGIKPVTINPPSNARKSQGGKRDFEAEKLAMGIDWMDKNEISQAIPPAYTEYIGKYLLGVVRD